MSLQKYFIPKNYIRYLRRLLNALQGDVFSNAGSITDEDFEQIRIGIEQVNPKIFIEIGTGKGISTKKIYNYLRSNYPKCHLYTLEVFKKYHNQIRKQFYDCHTFHALNGLSVLVEETTPPAYNELMHYSGPTDILRKLFNQDLKNRQVDIAFIDSRKGSARAEFLLLEKKLSSRGIIFCHDILNNGKGVEVLEYIQTHQDKYTFEVIDTGLEGMIKIRRRNGNC